MATVEHCLYCFEALSASLETRTPMTLQEVQASWADYPKGLEIEDGEEPGIEEDVDETEDALAVSSTSRAEGPSLRNPTIERLSTPRSGGSGTSTPISSASSSLESSTAATTPGSEYLCYPLALQQPLSCVSALPSVHSHNPSNDPDFRLHQLLHPNWHLPTPQHPTPRLNPARIAPLRDVEHAFPTHRLSIPSRLHRNV